jgi:hypothetical protein
MMTPWHPIKRKEKKVNLQIMELMAEGAYLTEDSEKFGDLSD